MIYRNVRPIVTTTFHNAAGDYEFEVGKIIEVGFQTDAEYTSGINTLYFEVDLTDGDDDHLTYEPVDLYLYNLVASPVLSEDTVVGDTTLTVVSSTGVAAGHAITIYNSDRLFQTLVTATTATTITLASSIDDVYTSTDSIETGLWNAAVDGEGTEQIFYIKPPHEGTMELHTVSIAMEDNAEMAIDEFGSLDALTNGVVFARTGSANKHLAILVNNLGFWESGFETHLDARTEQSAGFRAIRDIVKVNGTTLLLEGTANDTFKLTVRDDLSDMNQMTITVHGHMRT